MADSLIAIKVTIIETKGSTPRGVGASMLINPTEQIGTIGGGALEWEAIAHARKLLDGVEDETQTEIALGPKINQCCGGYVTLSYIKAEWTHDFEDAPQKQSIFIFGAGHTGTAIAHQFSLLEWDVHIIDERADWLARFDHSSAIHCHHTAIPESIITTAPSGAVFVITTHSHGQDFAITAAAIKRKDAAYIGMIGSKTKRARFRRWANDEGVFFSDSELDCPMGQKFEGGKAPEIIALNVAHQVIGQMLQSSKEMTHG